MTTKHDMTRNPKAADNDMLRAERIRTMMEATLARINPLITELRETVPDLPEVPPDEPPIHLKPSEIRRVIGRLRSGECLPIDPIAPDALAGELLKGLRYGELLRTITTEMRQAGDDLQAILNESSAEHAAEALKRLHDAKHHSASEDAKQFVAKLHRMLRSQKGPRARKRKR